MLSRLVLQARNCSVLEVEEHVIIKISKSDELIRVFRIGSQDGTVND